VRNTIAVIGFSFILLSLGARPGVAASEKTALLIVDMQRYFWAENHHRRGNPGRLNLALEQQARAIRLAKRARLPILLLEYDIQKDSTHPDNIPTHPALISAIGRYRNFAKFKKDQDGVFDARNTFRDEFIRYLNQNEIKRLIVAGANGGSCVVETISGALLRGLGVVAFSHGIIDFGTYNTDYIHPFFIKPETVLKESENGLFEKADSISELSAVIRKSIP